MYTWIVYNMTTEYCSPVRVHLTCDLKSKHAFKKYFYTEYRRILGDRFKRFNSRCESREFENKITQKWKDKQARIVPSDRI